MDPKVVFLSMCMLITGTINTISTKYQDLVVVGTKDGRPITFKHPIFQSACMFLGESLCIIPYMYMRHMWRREKRRQGLQAPPPSLTKAERIKRVFAFAIPALCDACATTLLNLGLYYTYASTYQMLRGTLVLFAGMFTVIILKRTLFSHHWFGMVLITAGAAIVGTSNILDKQNFQSSPSPMLTSTTSYGSLVIPDALDHCKLVNSTSDANLLLQHLSLVAGTHLGRYDAPLAGAPSHKVLLTDAWKGDALVISAQMFAALQFILEEKYLTRYKVPALLAVGLEGCWGVLLCTVLLPVFSVVPGWDGLPVDDAWQALNDTWQHKDIFVAALMSIGSIAMFNFFGISVTKSLSGAARATIDACRTLFIWLFSITACWERFNYLELVGFVVLLAGTSLYNEVLRSCLPGATSQNAHHHQQRRRVSSQQSETGQPTPVGDAETGTLTEPLLGGSAPRSSSVPVGRPPVPSRMVRVRSGQSDIYNLARSVRLGVSALSPHSLESTFLDSDSQVVGSLGASGADLASMLGTQDSPASQGPAPIAAPQSRWRPQQADDDL